MKKPDITKGEWKCFGSLEKTDLKDEICRIGISYTVLSDGDVSETAEADARVISAVPEMIDALIEVLENDMGDFKTVSEFGGYYLPKDIRCRIEQALKKAGCSD